jgi:hypothetical protein
VIAERPNLSPQELRQRAEEWFDRQTALLAMVHGEHWPEVREWLESYLRAEIRERLIALGWRPKR